MSYLNQYVLRVLFSVVDYHITRKLDDRVPAVDGDIDFLSNHFGGQDLQDYVCLSISHNHDAFRSSLLMGTSRLVKLNSSVGYIPFGLIESNVARLWN